MTEPFGDAERFRASLAIYEYAVRTREWSEAPLLREPNPTPTLILYGPEDHVIPRDFPQRMEAAFPERVGPFLVQDAGHFLQWERADVLNPAIELFLSGPSGTILRSDERPRAHRGPPIWPPSRSSRSSRLPAKAAERIKADARIEAQARGRSASWKLRASPPRTLVEDAHKESVQIREQTQRSVDGRVAAAEKAAAEVLEEARTLHDGMRRLGETLTDQAERMLRDVQAAHKQMQADLRVSADTELGRAGRVDSERSARRPATGPRVARPDERPARSEGRGPREVEPPARIDERAARQDERTSREAERASRSGRRASRLGIRGPRAEADPAPAEAPGEERPLRLARSASDERGEAVRGEAARGDRPSRFQRGPRDQRADDPARGARPADPSESERIIAAAEAARAQDDRPQAGRRGAGGPFDDLEVPSWVARKR